MASAEAGLGSAGKPMPFCVGGRRIEAQSAAYFRGNLLRLRLAREPEPPKQVSSLGSPSQWVQRGLLPGKRPRMFYNGGGGISRVSWEATNTFSLKVPKHTTRAYQAVALARDSLRPAERHSQKRKEKGQAACRGASPHPNLRSTYSLVEDLRVVGKIASKWPVRLRVEESHP